MALSWTDRGTGTDGSASSSIVCSPTTTIAAGSIGVLAIAMDNAGASGLYPFTWSVGDYFTDSVGNNWVFVVGRAQTAGSPNDGVVLTMFQSVTGLTTAFTSSDTLTLPLSTNTTAKAWAFGQISAGAGNTAEGGNAGGNEGTSTTPSVTTGSLASGRLLVGTMGAEYGDGTITGDSDTTRGTWTTQQKANVGTTTSGIEISMQAKVLTGTGAQTYNLTITSADWSVATRSWLEVTSTAKNSSDTGTGAESSSLSVTLTGTDTGAGADAVTSIAVSGTGDTGTGTDAASSIAAATSGADTGAGTEAGTLAVTTVGADTATGTEAGALAVVTTSADTATSSESGSLATTPSGAETGSGAEDAALAAALTTSDAGAGGEDGTLAVAIASSDTGTSADAGSVIETLAVSDSDFGTSADASVSIVAIEGETPAPEQPRFGGGPVNVAKLEQDRWEQELAELLREDEEILCLV